MVRKGGTIENKTYVSRDLTAEEVKAESHVKLTANTIVEDHQRPGSIYMKSEMAFPDLLEEIYLTVKE